MPRITEPATSARALSFVVPGEAQPQGSMRGYTVPRKGGRVGVRVTSQNERALKPWRTLVATCGRNERVRANRILETYPVRVFVTFVLPRKSHPDRTRVHHVMKPDLDKLVRALFDGLTGSVFVDDKQVVALAAGKVYTTGTEQPHTVVSIVRVD